VAVLVLLKPLLLGGCTAVGVPVSLKHLEPQPPALSTEIAPLRQPLPL